jgi:dihydroorotate dehydrogenase (fumarate)
MEFREDVYLGTKIQISPPLMNGGGCCKTIEHVKELSQSLAGAVLVGSITMEERSGNTGEIFWAGEDVALNSLGMPNGGMAYLHRHLAEMVDIVHKAKKALIVNVAGFNADEYASLAREAFRLGADAVELNLGCPNVVKDDGSRKPIPSFDLKVMSDILCAVEFVVGNDAPVWVKVSPYSDPGLLKEVAAVFLHYPVVKAVTAINTFPNAYGLKGNGKPIIDVGFAGLSGPALKHIGLGQIKQWHDALRWRVNIIAAGGICTGRDIADYQALGADAFQITTELLKSGDLNAHPFERVAAEYLDIAT